MCSDRFVYSYIVIQEPQDSSYCLSQIRLEQRRNIWHIKHVLHLYLVSLICDNYVMNCY